MTDIIFYVRPGIVNTSDWKEIPADVRAVYDRLGIPEAERRVLAGIGGGCQQPLGALATVREDGGIRLRAAFAGEEGIRKAEAEGRDDEAALASVLAQMGWK